MGSVYQEVEQDGCVGAILLSLSGHPHSPSTGSICSHLHRGQHRTLPSWTCSIGHKSNTIRRNPSTYQRVSTTSVVTTGTTTTDTTTATTNTTTENSANKCTASVSAI